MIGKYEWGVEYATIDYKPELGDDVIVSIYIGSDKRWHTSRVGEFNWTTPTIKRFCIIDERCKPVSKNPEFKPDAAVVSEKSESKPNATIVSETSKSNWYERGELPPVGMVCESYDFSHSQWVKVKTLDAETGSKELACVTVDEYGSYGRLFFGCKFRPIRTEREKTIDAAKNVIEKNTGDYPNLEALYDAGLLRLPD